MEFRILGPLSVWNEQGEVQIGAAKQRALLVLLLLRRGDLVPTETLIDELWGDQPPATALKTVQVYVSRLRELLGDGLIETRPGGYQLRLRADDLDANRFEHQIGDARTLLGDGHPDRAQTLLNHALALWRGPPLAEFRYENWARDEINGLEELRLVALEHRLEADLALGRHSKAVPELEALIREQPLRENLRRLLMLALYRSGRQAEALAAYRDARAALADELGLEPSKSLQQLETAILRHDPALDLPAPTRALPTPQPTTPARPASAPRSKAPRRPGRRPLLVVLICGAIVTAAAAVATVLLTDGGHPSAAGGARTVHTDAIVGTNAVVAVGLSTRRIAGAARLEASPGAIAYGHGSLWVTMPSEDAVARVDPTTRSVQQTIQVGKGPAGIAFGGGFIWVVNSLDGTVTEIDPRTDGGRVVNTIPVGSGPTGIAYGLGGVWVANSVDETVVRIDPLTGAPGAPISVPAGADAVAVGGGAVWVTSQSANVLSRIDPGSRIVLPIAVGNGPDAVAATAAAVWVVNATDATVWRIDPATNHVTSVIGVGEKPSGIAVAPRGGTVWVSNELAGTLSRINPAVDRVVKTVPVGDLPQGVALSPDAAYVAVQGSETAHRGGTLTLAVRSRALGYNVGLPKAVDPGAGYSDWELLTLTNDGLVDYGRSGGVGSTSVVADLAVTLPTVTDGGRTYTFQLRPGIRYSTGAPLRPQDFRRGIERSLLLSGRELPSSYLTGIVGAAKCVSSPGHCNLSKGIATARGSDTITFHLTAPDPDFLYKLALPIADAVPATTPLRARLPLPATGPYEIAKVDAKQGEIDLVRNPGFRVWSAAAQPEGFPDQIVERFGYTAKTAVEAVERGTADITSDDTANQPWAPSLASMLQTRYSSQLHSAPIPGTVALWLNTRLPPFNDVRVRQALNDAVDRNRLVALAGGPDVAQVSCQVLPPNVGGFRRYCPYTLGPNPAGTYNGPDLAAAQRLVTASGTKGQPVTVWFYEIPIGRADGAYVVSVLRGLGYDAHLRLVPQVGSTWQPDRQAGIGGWAEDYPSANDFFSTQFACNAYDPAQPGRNSNTSGFCDPHVDAEIARASAFQATDPPAASRLWTKIDRQITLQAPWVVIRSGLETDFVSRRTGNYTYCYLNAEDGTTGACLDQLWLRSGGR